MPNGVVSALAGILLSVALAPALHAQAVSIEHTAVACVVADGYPRIDARFSPDGVVGRGRVYFRASGTDAWYFVEMKSEAGTQRATLPRPKRETKAIDYYVEALDSALSESRTAEFSPRVVARASDCEAGRVLAASVAAAKVVVGAAAGAPAVPAGFAGSGLVTTASGAGAAGAGGGISGGAVVGIVAGVAAIGGGVAVAAGSKGEGESSSPSPSPGLSSSGPTVLNIAFGPPPGLNVSVCAGRPLGYSSQVVVLRQDGTFDDVWSPSEPNTVRAVGRADATSLQATLSCAATGSPTGSMSATGSGFNLSGSFSFAGSQGPISVTRQ